MNTNNSSPLIDESEIRDALSFIRIDRDAFGRGVRERVEQAAVEPASTDDENLNDRGGLLRVAASVLPINMLGTNTTATQTTWATLGGCQKAIAYLALPAVSILMIAVTIRSWFRIRSAQRSQSHPDADMARMEKSLFGWWRRYKWAASFVFVLSLAAPFVGWTTPLLLLFMASAIGTASIVTTLGRAGLVDRNVIGGNCIAMLGLLGQVSLIFANNNKTYLLDPHLVTATFFAGSTFLFLFINPFALSSGTYAIQRVSRRNIILVLAGFACLLAVILLRFIDPKSLVIVFAFIVLVALGGLVLWYSNRWPVDRIVVRRMALVLFVPVTALFGHTLWRPIGTSTLVRQVETFEPRIVGHWSYWQATARWLQDQGIDYDQSAVQTRWLDAWEDEFQRSYLLSHVVSTGLKLPSELTETEKFKAAAKRLLSDGSAGLPISSLYQYEYVIAALAEEGALSNEQRDHLAGRLLATWRSLNEDRVIDAAIITNLLSLIDRPLAEAERKEDVGRWLGEYQVKKGGPFTLSGGFSRYSSVNGSDLMSTEHAVRLMQHYGTHDSVDVLALRAFLRPAWSDRLVVVHYASARAAIRQRLDQIPGIPQPSLWDYIRLHQSLWFAVLLVGLCIYATLGSPEILNEASDQE